MGDLKNQIFLQYINRAIDQAREEYIKKNTPKINKRFYIKGITYELGSCRFEGGAFKYEISSKIPQELIFAKNGNEQYFRRILKIMNTAPKKPAEYKLENIVQNTPEMEHKERDYVKLVYEYDESELHSPEEVDKRFKRHKTKNIPFPNFAGVSTPSGKLVIAIVEEKMGDFVRQSMDNLIMANEEVRSHLKSEPAPPSNKPATAKVKPKKSAPAKKAATKPRNKPAAIKPKAKKK